MVRIVNVKLQMQLTGFIVWKPLDVFVTFSLELKTTTTQRLQPKCQIEILIL